MAASKVRWKVLIAVLLAFIVAAVRFPSAPPIYVDTSQSLPGTLFLRVSARPLEVGDVVAFCLDEEARALALERRYVRPVRGRCDHQVLLKAVIAEPGSRISVNRNRLLTIDGIETTLAVQASDSAGRGLVSAFGAVAERLAQDEYLLVGTHAQSWDSRYFGGVRRVQVLGRYRPLSVRASELIDTAVSLGRRRNTALSEPGR